MSTPAALPRRHALPLSRGIMATTAVVIARLLARLPPRHLATVLRVVSRGAAPSGYAEAARARAAVITVSLFCAGEGCLPRAIATALVCRAHGTWPTWRVGVRTAPFAAHAWVEAEGRPVDEPRGTERFRVLMTVAGPGD